MNPQKNGRRDKRKAGNFSIASNIFDEDEINSLDITLNPDQLDDDVEVLETDEYIQDENKTQKMGLNGVKIENNDMTHVINKLSNDPSKNRQEPDIDKVSNSSSKNYEFYLKVAKERNFDELKNRKIIYKAGVDFSGRQVVVLIGDIPKHIHTDDLFLYFISVMDSIVENDYTFIYIRVSGASTPSIGWLRKVYQIFTRKYKKNLKRLFIVNPNFFIKTACNLFRPFISSKFWKKLSFVKQVDDLTKFISKNQLQLPDNLLNTGSKPNPKKLFGVDLELVMDLPINKNKDVPNIVENALLALNDPGGIKTEGIFRLPGSTNRIQEIKDEYDKGGSVDLRNEDIHVTASVLKLFLRDLPNPLIPFELYDTVVSSYAESDKELTLKSLSISMQFLPKVNTIVLYELMKLLNKVSSMSSENKMTTKNLAIVFSPNILKSKDESPELIFQHMTLLPSILQIMIDEFENILTDSIKKFRNI